jgi:hypothetical protein
MTGPVALKTALVLLVFVAVCPAQARSNCPWPQTCMTPYGETIRGVFRPWPKGDPPIDWAARNYQPIISPQHNIGRRKIR